MQKQFTPGKLFLFDLQQHDARLLIGGERFDVRFVKEGFTPVSAAKPAEKPNASLLKAYQQGEQLMLNINDDNTYLTTIANNNGRVFFMQNITRNATVNVSNYQQGIYFIKLVNAKDKSVLATQVMIH